MLHSKPKQLKILQDFQKHFPVIFKIKNRRLVSSLNLYAFAQYLAIIAAFIFISDLEQIKAQTSVGFGSSTLAGTGLNNPTSLQFGPDGRLYVAQQNGIIKIFTIQRVAANNYVITNSEQIDLIAQMPNRNDDGSITTSVWGRQVTGLLVKGTALLPVIYISSSDPRIGAGPDTGDSNLDTNSGILHRLNWNGSQWVKTDLVRGLPRSEENHATNGLYLDETTNILYMAQGGHTNMGALSANFVFHPEYALSAAILAVNLTAIGNTTYDLPTLDDEDRTNISTTPGFTDANDPFGGNDGKNQAMLVPGGPVQVYASGFRNPYDIVVTQLGKMYTFDNGPNGGWGGPPSSCIYAVSEPGTSQPDGLHLVSGQGYYGGHPNLTRGNRNNTYNSTNPQSPVPPGMENPVECTYLYPGVNDGSLTTIGASTNGICEYTAGNFGTVMKGDLLAVSWNNKVYRIKLNNDGTQVISGGVTELFSGLSSLPLDIIAQGDSGPFPGTIWTANVFGNAPISIFEPNDYEGGGSVCEPNNLPPSGDADGDGFTNADELLNNTNPCSAASKPNDNDGDFVSDLADTDDDNDGILDVNDAFAIDSSNGNNQQMPFSITWDNNGIQAGGIQNTGFKGLMTNGVTNYLTQYNLEDMTIGGAAGVLTVDEVSDGNALGLTNTQQYAFQSGVKVQGINYPYTLRSRIKAPFAGITPVNNQSLGIFIGTGNQSSYLKVVIHANAGLGGIEVVKEVNDIVSNSTVFSAPVLGTNWVDLFLIINPTTLTVQPAYSVNGSARINLGTAISIPASWISNVLAVGIISTSAGSGAVFSTTWDFIDLKPDPLAVSGVWQPVNCNGYPGTCTSQLTARRDNAFVQSGNNFYLLGGRGLLPVNIYQPSTNSWSTGATPPVEIHHFQAVEVNGLIFAPFAFTGNYPNETPVSNMYYYDPVANVWGISSAIPDARKRGAAGSVAYNGKIYTVGGITNGHVSGWVPWMDVYDPLNNTWTILPDAPRARTHFQTVVVNDKLYVLGGHQTGAVNSTIVGISEVDVFDLVTGTWTTLPTSANIPTPRSAPASAVMGNEILVIGGTHPTQTTANKKVEAFDVNTQTWRTLNPMTDNRHGTQAIVNNSNIFIASGSANTAETANNGKMERFYFFTSNTPTGIVLQKGNLTSNLSTVNFPLVTSGGSYNQTITLTNSSGNQSLILTSYTLEGSSAFSVSATGTLPKVIAPGQSVTVQINFTPTSNGSQTGTLLVGNSGQTSVISIALSGTVEPFSIRLNCGGGEYTALNGKIFAADAFYSENSSVFTTWIQTPINNSTDDELFQTQRNGYANGLSYNIPLPQSGLYLVNLYFAELTATANGQRLFDINFEGGPAEQSGFDIFAQGGVNQAVLKSYSGISVTDGILNINFTATINASAIAAIEIIAQEGIAPPTPDVLFVVKSATLNTGETAVKNRLQSSGYTVTVVTQSNASSASATGKSLVVVSSEIDANVIGAMFKNVPVPFLSWEAWIFDDMCMTNSTSGTHFGQQTNNSTNLTISNATHPIAAGLTGTVSVYSTGQKMMWGVPNSQATIIAKVSNTSNKATIFAYETGTTMFNSLVAPARRVGFFLNNNTAGTLNTNGWNLFDAAVCWAMNCNSSVVQPPPAPPANTPPVFSLSPSSVTVPANFATPQIITVTPVAVPSAETGQTVTYTLSPPSVTFAILNINNSTGQVTITAMPSLYGTQIFTIIANDGQIINNVATQTFTLTVEPPQNPGGNTFAIRLNCGGAAYTDPNGNLFAADNYFTGDGTSLTLSAIANTNSQTLYKSERYGWAGNLTYSIPVPQSGSYTIKLHFAEIYWTASGQRIFGANIEGGPVELSNYDIIADAGAANTAVVKQFDNINVTDGVLNIQFTANVNAAKISAIEVLGTSGGTNPPVNTPPSFTISTNNINVPANFTTPQIITVNPTAVPPAEASQVVTYSLTPASVIFANVSINSTTGQVSITPVLDLFGTQTFTITANDGQATNNLSTQNFTLTVTAPTGGETPIAIRLNCGGGAYTDTNGNVFAADNYYSGDGTYLTLSTITNTTNQTLYKSERYGWSGNLAYNIPVPNSSNYTVKLHFAEIYWTTPGQRIFSVNIEGGPLELNNYDIVADAGASNTAVIKQFDNVTVTDGMLNINFTASVNASKISAIEILGSTGGGTNPPANTPPAFTLSTNNINVAANFSTPQTITVTPATVPPTELSQVVTYSLSPDSVVFANVSINSSTGQVSITPILDLFGTQTFIITANDGQASNYLATQTFTLTVSAPTGGGSNVAIRLNCGGGAFTDSQGNVFDADNYFAGDGTFATLSSIDNTTNDALYQTERLGWVNNLTYQIPVPSSGLYTVKLHFAEIYWTTTGQRVFNVNMEGGDVELQNYDIIADAGAPNTAVIKQFDNILINDGVLNIQFSAVTNAGKISAIEILGTQTSGGNGQGNQSSGKYESESSQQLAEFEKNEVLIFPNPTSGKIQLTFEQPLKDGVILRLVDNQGRLVKNIYPELTIDSEIKSLQINMEEIPTGLYFLQIETEKFVTTKKVIKR
ncbi:MAG: T9SS type A sorting domain-containing protein [Sphingobacteriales bacterium]|nr:MAG: T9SS type A sorting domain-containing protein [Sphingobacteriales bacterium]